MMTPFRVVTKASWKQQFGGKRDNKGENARINSQRAGERYREHLQPASLLPGAPSSLLNAMNPDKVQMMMVRNGGNN